VRNAKYVIVLWSHHAARSEWVERECKWAIQDKKLVPVVIDDISLPPKWEDFLWLKLTNFDKQKSELRSKLGPPTAIPRIKSLPSPARLFIGRGTELSDLRKAWCSTENNANPAEKTNVFVLHAIGGAGKTALVHQFLHPSGNETFPGAVYAWSAYSQGSGDNRVANADEFIASALPPIFPGCV
jgi:hypothetical protein